MENYKNLDFEKIKTMAKSFGATRLFIFGSFLDDPQKARDLDLACDGIDGWKLYEFAARLEKEFRVICDVAPLKPVTKFTRLIEKRGKQIL